VGRDKITIIKEGTALFSPEALAQHLAAYCQEYLLKETEFVEVRGIPLPEGIGQIPLDKVYIQLQAVAQQEQRRQREEEEAELRARAEAVSRNPVFLQNRVSKGGDRDAGPPISVAALRLWGEFFYRQGSAYRSEERPQPVDPTEALTKHKRLVVLGAPGSGKSTLLRYLARQAAKNPAGPVPILVSLRDFAYNLSSGSRLGLREFALKRIADLNPTWTAAVEQATGQGRALWLVDALDEARGEWGIEAARQAYHLPGQIIVTSRPIGYPGGLESLAHFEVLPLTPANVDQFVADWFGVLGQSEELTGWRNLPGLLEWMQERQAWLKRSLAEQPRLKPLVSNPLLLTFLVILACDRQTASLPPTRAGLYAEYIVRLFRSRETARQFYVEPQRAERRLAIGPLEGEPAYELALHGLYYLGWRLHLAYYGGQMKEAPDEANLVTCLVAYLSHHHPDRLGPHNPTLAAKAILAFWQEAGLLDTWPYEGQTFFAFRHLTFQEYAAAQALKQAWLAGREARNPVFPQNRVSNPPAGRKAAWRFLRPRLHLPPWREPLILLGQILDPAESQAFIKQILHARSPYEGELRRDLRLAAAVIAGGAPVGDEMARRVFRRLAELDRPMTQLHRAMLVGTTYLVELLVLWWGLATMTGWNNWLALGIVILGWSLFWYGSARFAPSFWQMLTWPTRIWSRSAYMRGFLVYLGQLGDPRAIDPLLRMLQDKDSDVRLNAAGALGGMGNPRGVDPLLRALHDKDGNVRLNAAGALVQLGDQSLDPLIRTLRDKDRDVRTYVAWALGQLGDPRAIDPMLQALQDKEGDVRRNVAWALGQLGDPRAIDPMLQALQDKEGDVRRNVAWALGQLGDPRAIDFLLQTLQDEDGYVRLHAAGALVQLSDQSLDPLLQMLQDKDWYVRKDAAKALGQLGDPRAIDPLLQTLRDDNREVRENAAEALGQLGDRRAVMPLFVALREKSTYSRTFENTAAVLKQLDDPRVVDLLLLTLENEDWSFRQNAAEALGQLGDSRAVGPLLRALRDENEFVRATAVEALGQLGNSRAIDPLLQALRDKDSYIRWRAAKALSKINYTPALQRILRAAWWVLADIDQDVQNQAYQTFEQAAQRLAVLEGEQLPARDVLIERAERGFLGWTDRK
jgi:HEAT repeat protein/energy-coupling factor transporter ATP-binding protein EcfA2